MKNLMQKLVKAILCIGVVSVSLIACDPAPVEDTIIQLDQLDDQVLEMDSSLVDSTVYDDEQIEDVVIEEEI